MSPHRPANPSPAPSPRGAPENRSAAHTSPGNTRRGVAVSPNGDRITVQSVSQTTAGEYLEWTITVRRSSPAAVGDPLNGRTAGARELLPEAVRAALGDWLADRAPRDPGAEKTAQRATQPKDGPPLLVGRDFTVGDRRTMADTARDHENRLQRAEPNPNLLTLWNNTFTEHVDVLASVLTDRGNLRLRVHFGHRPLVQAFVRDHDGDLHARWRGATWRVRSIAAPRGGLDVELEETRPAAEHIEAPTPPTLEDHKQLRRDLAASRPGHVTACTECGGAPDEVHPAWCTKATVIATPAPPTKPTALFQPRAYNRPEFVGTVPKYGKPAMPAAPGRALCGDANPDTGDQCELYAGHTSEHRDPTGSIWPPVWPELVSAPDGAPICGQRQPDEPYVCTRPRSHTGQHAAHDSGSDDTPVSVWPPEPPVPPMPGGPNDKLTQAANRQTLRGVTTTGPLADLYARIEHLHDATAEPCPGCNGDGSISTAHDGTDMGMDFVCTRCNGSGTTDKDDK